MSGTAAGPWIAWLAEEAARRVAAQSERHLRTVTRERQWARDPDGRRMVNLMSNDYLAMSCHPEVIEAARVATSRGAGAGSARLMAGTDPAYVALEDKLAAFHGTDRALIFGSGYLANVGVLSALVGPNDVVFSDRLNHASIVDGCRLSGARFYRYRHGDAQHLESLLDQSRRAGHRRTLIVTESVFSMDGDRAPLVQIAQLRDRYDAALVVDEAHAVGVLGPRGAGLVAEAGLAERVDLRIGTFGKALGSYGAYATGDARFVDQLVNTARTFLFSTALPPAVIGAVDVSLDLVATASQERSRLAEMAMGFRSAIGAMGLTVMGSTTPIVPVVVGDNARALETSRRLELEGVWARAIRPPTVPANSSRLRFSLTCALTNEDLTHTLGALRRALSDDEPRT